MERVTMSLGRASSVHDLLEIHYRYVNRVIESAGSVLLKKEFKAVWSRVNHGDIDAPVGDILSFDGDDIISEIKNWIGNMEVVLDGEIAAHQEIETPDFQDQQKLRNVTGDIHQIIDVYESLISVVEDIEMEFAN